MIPGHKLEQLTTLSKRQTAEVFCSKALGNHYHILLYTASAPLRRPSTHNDYSLYNTAQLISVVCTALVRLVFIVYMCNKAQFISFVCTSLLRSVFVVVLCCGRNYYKITIYLYDRSKHDHYPYSFDTFPIVIVQLCWLLNAAERMTRNTTSQPDKRYILCFDPITLLSRQRLGCAHSVSRILVIRLTLSPCITWCDHVILCSSDSSSLH